jgi:hypothetical protein
MPEPIDAAVEQVVKCSGDRDALTVATRELAGLLGFELAAKPLPRISVGDRVRLLRDRAGVRAGACGEVIDLIRAAAVDVLFDGQQYRMLCRREDVGPVVEQDDAGYETDADPKPLDGEHGTCVFGCAIRYVERDGLSWWAHETEPADGHDAEIGGPA